MNENKQEILCEVKGKPMTDERLIIAALVRKLGGKVTLTDVEIFSGKGWVMHGDIYKEIEIVVD